MLPALKEFATKLNLESKKSFPLSSLYTGLKTWTRINKSDMATNWGCQASTLEPKWATNSAALPLFKTAH